MAAGTGSSGRGGEAAGELHQPPAFGRARLGLAAASTAITLAVSEPPPWLDRNAYSFAISGLFFAGITQVGAASVWAPSGGHGGAAGRKLVMFASLAVAAGLAAAASLLL